MIRRLAAWAVLTWATLTAAGWLVGFLYGVLLDALVARTRQG